MLAALMGIAMVLEGAALSLPTPPPLGPSPRDPEWRTVETAYRCGNEDARFTVRFDARSNASILRAQRALHRWSASELNRVNRELERLTSVSSIQTHCGGTIHIITAVGTYEGEPACVLIAWNERSVQATSPFPANEPRPLCRWQ